MGRKCCVVGCTTGYRTNQSKDKISIYGFPKDTEKCREWLACLPNKLAIENVTGNMGVCAIHWPVDVPMLRPPGSRFEVPTIPPTVFPNIPPSCIPTPVSTTTPRHTKKSTVESRTVDIDEMSEFLKLDSLGADNFDQLFQERLANKGYVTSYNNTFVFFSANRTGPVPDFCVYFYIDEECKNFSLRYEAYKNVLRVYHNFLKSVKTWSQFDEIVRFVSTVDDCENDKVNFINRNISLLNAPKNKRVYTHSDLLLAFTWLNQSRSLYLQLRNHLQLPSISTLKKITTIAKNTSDDNMFLSVFSSMDERNRNCILIIDEIYVKASVTYRGGSVFGYAVDNPDKIATTLLCVMVKCFFGGQTFLAKILPCHALTSLFQFNQVCDVISLLEKCGATVIGIVNDNNRVNQSFFKMFKSHPSSPWRSVSPTDSTRPLFLLYDTVHLVKNIRNNWHSEKLQQLEFFSSGEPQPQLAKWSDLVDLYNHEQHTMVKLSELTKSAIFPTNIEKQKVPLALQVFSEKTSAALKTSSVSQPSWKITAAFIDSVLDLWRVLNTKSSKEHIRFRNPVRRVIDSTEEGQRQVQILKAWAEFAKLMKTAKGQRIKSFTKDTAAALEWTCNCLQDLSNYLLTTETSLKHKYVALGFCQQDDIEHHFAHFRMSAGCTYYITAEDVAHTHALDRAKLMLESDPSITLTYLEHSCPQCRKHLTDDEVRILDCLQDLVCNISSDEKMALFYIGGYVASKHPNLKGDNAAVPSEVQCFTISMDRGGLSIPSAGLFQLLTYAYTFVTHSKEQMCRKRLVNIFSDFPALFHFEVAVEKTALVRITNILLKRFCLQRQTEHGDGKQQRRKVAKLTSSSQ